jgi:hypothetical protein
MMSERASDATRAQFDDQKTASTVRAVAKCKAAATPYATVEMAERCVGCMRSLAHMHSGCDRMREMRVVYKHLVEMTS